VARLDGTMAVGEDFGPSAAEHRSAGEHPKEGSVAKERGGFWVGVAAVVFYPATRLLGRRRFQGLEQIPADGPALVVANHISYIDPIYSAVFVHRRGRVPRFLAKASLWKIPVFRSILVSSGQIPVYRGSSEARDSLRAAHQALREGKVVVIYPEGTITRDPDHWPMSSRTGAARLALEHDVPVIPLVQWNTHRVYDHYRKKFRPLPRKDVVVRAGAPVDLSAYRGREIDAALLREVTDLLMGRVRDLLAEVRGEPAPSGFYQPPTRSGSTTTNGRSSTDTGGATAGGDGSDEVSGNGVSGNGAGNDGAGDTTGVVADVERQEEAR